MWYGHPGGWGYGMGYGMGGGFGGWFMLLLLVLVVVFAIGPLRDAFDSRRGRRHASRDALDILDERYGRGEIDADEYKRRRADLGRR